MTEAVRSRLDLTLIYVALIGVLPVSATAYWTTRHDPQKEVCTIAAQYVGSDRANPSITAVDRIRLSSAMVRKTLECVR